jgi:hypothetical protein
VAGLFNWGGRKAEAEAVAPPPPTKASSAQAPAAERSTKVLPRFLAALSSIESPVLLNLGPVVGQNIAFFGERLGCKIFVEDLAADLAVSPPPAAELRAVLEKRLPHKPGTIDGILCWDLFDLLDRATSQALAAYLTERLKPGGVLYAFFGSTAAPITQYTKYIAAGPESFELRTSPAPAPAKQRNVLVTRDINKMFEGLVVTESVLLKSNTRETLFRKPS